MTPLLLKSIRRLVRPYCWSLSLVSRENGPHLQGLAPDGTIVEWASVEDALDWANRQYCDRMGRAVA